MSKDYEYENIPDDLTDEYYDEWRDSDAEDHGISYRDYVEQKEMDEYWGE